MKKILSVALVLVMVLCLFAGCGNKPASSKEMKVGFIFLHNENST